MTCIYGLDFTSAPRRGKPITCAAGTLAGDVLTLETCEALDDFAAFEAFLARPGPWVAGLDFPFGQPARLVAALGWESAWTGYVAAAGQLDMAGFEALLTAYRAGQPPGDKHHLRATDARAGARSPMMLHGVPVGRMFLRGAPRLLRAGVQVLPCHSNGDPRIALEAYPALVARRWAGTQGYKSDTRGHQTPAQAEARQMILDGLRGGCRAVFGFDLDVPSGLAVALVDDPQGDALDASLCAIQAAWASTRPDYGIPPTCNADEGWIVDPAL